MEPPADAASLRTQIVALQAELNALRDRYDTLLEAHNRAAERYKADYKKWRDFKRWMFHDANTDEHVKSLLKSGELVAYIGASALGKRKQPEDFALNLGSADVDDEPKSFKSEPTEVLPSSPPVALGPRYQRRKSYHNETSIASEDPFLVPLSTDCESKSSMHEHNNGPPCKGEPSQPPTSTEPRKGRGRYAQAPTGACTINSRFSIRKEKNNGVDFQYDAVVRNQQERKHMLGSDCECCREYYEAVGPLPASRQPLWRTPTKRKALQTVTASDNDKENTDGIDEHKQMISRHRHHWHRPKTPPGYWDIGFPDTQEVLDINRRAAEMHKRKLVDVETEARNNDGRYVERMLRSP